MPTSEPKTILTFDSWKKWEGWLSKNHAQEEGIWLKFYKKASGKQTFTYGEALDVALCYGWIDTMANKLDTVSYIQKFTPRRAKSIWSRVNIGHVKRLSKEGRMKPAGLEKIAAAKKDGRWDQAYDSPSRMKHSEDFLGSLNKNKKAKAFFETLNKANHYAIAWRIQTAKKPETREKRIKKIITMLNKHERFH